MMMFNLSRRNMATVIAAGQELADIPEGAGKAWL